MISASHYVTSASRYQSRSSMYIHGLILQNSTELEKASVKIMSKIIIILLRVSLIAFVTGLPHTVKPKKFERRLFEILVYFNCIFDTLDSENRGLFIDFF